MGVGLGGAVTSGRIGSSRPTGSPPSTGSPRSGSPQPAGEARRAARPYRRPAISGAAAWDVIVAIGALSLIAALLYPTLRERAFQGLVERAVADVEALRSIADQYRLSSGTWAAPAGPGRRPPELEGPAIDSIFAREEYTIEWRRWEVVEMEEVALLSEGPGPEEAGEAPLPILVPTVRLLGGIALHTGQEALLAELLERYGDTISFVRDSTWTLVLPERTEMMHPPR